MAFRAEALADSLSLQAKGLLYRRCRPLMCRAGVFACMVALTGAPLTFTAHKQVVSVGDAGITAESRHWAWTDIQRLTLAPDKLTILTYENRKWRLPGDREYVFDRLPPGTAEKLYPVFRARLDQRFIAMMPDRVVQALWQTPAKTGRANGTLTIGADRIVFETPERDRSRTWRYTDIAGVSHEGPFDLSLAAYDGRVTRFQLKEPLKEERFNALWQSLETTNGLKTYRSHLTH